MKDSIDFAREIRIKTLELVYKAKASHIGGAFSMADILAVLYTDVLNISPNDPDHKDRDRFFLSKGHACTSLYATLGLKGFFPLELLSTYAQDGSNLLSHTSHKVPGVEISAGSLGHALSVASGAALAANRKKENWQVYCLLSDGELDEGSNWEAILFAPHHKLTNLTLIIDYNKIQSFGSVAEVLNLDPLDQKFAAFGWNVTEIDGHDHAAIRQELTRPVTDKPKVILANTVKGKGVDFMEHSLLWHYRSPDQTMYESALQQLQQQ